MNQKYWMCMWLCFLRPNRLQVAQLFSHQCDCCIHNERELSFGEIYLFPFLSCCSKWVETRKSGLFLESLSRFKVSQRNIQSKFLCTLKNFALFLESFFLFFVQTVSLLLEITMKYQNKTITFNKPQLFNELICQFIVIRWWLCDSHGTTQINAQRFIVGLIAKLNTFACFHNFTKYIFFDCFFSKF